MSDPKTIYASKSEWGVMLNEGKHGMYYLTDASEQIQITREELIEMANAIIKFFEVNRG